MIGRLRGEIIAKHPPHLVVEVGGIGYELEAPMTTFYSLPALGESITLFTHLQVREDAHILYGFADDAARGLFRALLKISGVGAKMALAILSGMDSEAFARCVRAGDTTALIRLPGVGRKTAERLVIEMRDRLDGKAVAASLTSTVPPETPADPVDDAVRALIALGYKLQEASRMVNRVESGNRSSEEIIRLALKASLT
ncbi:MAG: Holliday junction branch migration protein RuvA [Pseudomonadota bacterium]|jgi:holliday junction DNA helicase RuvA|nr:Holliday junction branch migration protein RuvA [Pseudomonadota bacterium]